MNLLFKTAIGLGVAMTTSFAIASDPNHRFVQVEEAKNLSQLIRSNSQQYWAYMKSEADTKDLKPYLAFRGILAGDPHLGNFSVIPVTNDSGRRALKFVNVDFDDAGVGPFALDFVRLVIASKAANENVKLKHLLEAYINGLGKGRMDPPATIKEALSTSLSEYDSQVDAYVAKKMEDGKLERKEKEIEDYPGPIRRAEIAAVLPAGSKILDVAKRPKDRGGSANALRLWALVQDKSERLRIFELKQYQPTGMLKFGPQPDPQALVSEVHKAFWTGIDPSSYRVVKVGSAGLFWLREKKVDLFTIDYKSEETEDLEFIEELAAYDAYQLGLAHGSQKMGPAFLKVLQKEEDEFRGIVKPIIHEYLDSARRAYEKAN